MLAIVSLAGTGIAHAATGDATAPPSAPPVDRAVEPALAAVAEVVRGPGSSAPSAPQGAAVQGLAASVVGGLTAPVGQLVGSPVGPPAGGHGGSQGGPVTPVVDAIDEAVKPLDELTGARRPLSDELGGAVAKLAAPLGPVVAPPHAHPDSGGGGATTPPVSGERAAVPVLAFGRAGGGAGLPGAGLTPAAPCAVGIGSGVRAGPAAGLARRAAGGLAARHAGRRSSVAAPAPSLPGLPTGVSAEPVARPMDPRSPAPAGVPARLVPVVPSAAGGRSAGSGAGPDPTAPVPDSPAPPPEPTGLGGVPGGSGTSLLFGIAALCGLVGLARPPDALRSLPPAPANPVPVALTPSLERPG